jgi:hypothetical protein
MRLQRGDILIHSGNRQIIGLLVKRKGRRWRYLLQSPGTAPGNLGKIIQTFQWATSASIAKGIREGNVRHLRPGRKKNDGIV